MAGGGGSPRLHKNSGLFNSSGVIGVWEGTKKLALVLFW
jgi:hypothetical protein